MAANNSVVKGKDGVVHVGTEAVGNMKEWSYEETAAQADTTVMGDDDTTTVSLQNSWTANVSGLYNPKDTAGQGALTVGSEITATFYPAGIATGNIQATGKATITSISKTAAHDNVGNFTAALMGNGPLTESVQA